MDGFYPPEEIEGVQDAYLSLLEVEHDEDDDAFLKKRYLQVKEKVPEIDKVINAKSTAWRTDRMDPVVLSILRVSIYEMMYDKEVPRNVSINEAVELGKLYGGAGAYALINGILAGTAAQLAQEEG
ncbi:MAG: transcription antitermination factor NusB [Blautia sp.]|nr:transcription antitermination factor NusB [Blautia sp.]